MNDNLISQLMGAIKSQVLPPVQRYFTYFFILIAIVWLVWANYYYITSETDKSIGSLSSGIIFLIMALFTYMWENYINKKTVINKSIFSEMMIKALPFLAPTIYRSFKDILLNRRIFKFLLMGIAAYTFKQFLNNNKNGNWLKKIF
ncbi:MAG: hypothetical protein EOP33_04215 [Rickettsiaceae bacterium]|nr:MAG: hypothetical protein EOP33_04215 [Rickettsiaceae bacterium]